MNTSNRSLSPRPVQPKLVRTNSLEANPYNPRRLFDKEPLDVLRVSIKKVGILVPLTVYWSKKKGKHVILDGQRRWMCAQALALKEVPVNVVAEPSVVQNIVTMFQIHKLREDWELMPTALTLAILIEQTGEKRDRLLSEITGLDSSVVSRCKKLLSYPKRYQDMMLDPDPSKRIKADFFIELYAVRNDRAVNKMAWFKKNNFTGRMLEKYRDGKSGLKAVTDFRLMKQYINNARRAHQLPEESRRLKEFVDNDQLRLDHLNIPSADVSASARRLLLAVSKLVDDLKQIDPEDYFGQEQLWKALETLRDVVATKLEEADRRIK